MKKIIALVLIMVTVFTGCGANSISSTVARVNPDGSGTVIAQKTGLSYEGGLALESLKRVNENINEKYVNNLSAFAAETVKRTFSADRGNYLYSPASLYLALALLADAADEGKVDDLYQLLGVSSREELINQSAELIKGLTFNEKQQILRIVNSIWLDKEFELSESAKKRMEEVAKEMFADLYVIDLGADNQLITDWVKDRTNGFLPNYQPTANGDTVMALINVLYLKLKWEHDFDKKDVKPRDFTLDNGQVKEVDMIHFYDNSYKYYEGENSIATKLYYQDGSYCLFIRPNDGVSLNDVMNKDLEQYFKTVPTTAGKQARVDLRFPKLNYEAKLGGLEKVIESMGVSSVMHGGALRTIDSSLMVQQISQATKIVMDEKGTEAVAVTEIDMKCEAVMEEPLPLVKIILDRSYAYVIMSADGCPLFIGAVSDPTKE